MKIALVYFDIKTGYYPSLHHGIAYLAGYLKEHGYPVSFYHIIEENIISTVWSNLKDADVIGVSIVTNQLKYFDKFVDVMPSEFKGKLIAGGVHPTLMYQELLEQYPRVDGVCIGEGEIAFCQYIDAIKSGNEFYDINGFAFRNKKGDIFLNKLPSYSKIEDLGYPDYTIFNYQKIIAHSANTFPMMLTRGCPFSCSYCSNHALQHAYESTNGYVRFPTVNNALEIIKNNLKIYPKTKCITFADDTFTLNKKWVTEFCRRYKKEINIPFDCNARVETINEKILQELKIAGCITLHFGIESGSEWLRKNILKRKQSNEKIIEIFKLARKFGVKTTSSTITGLPFETQAMFNETFKLIRHIRPNFGSCFFFFPYPKTVLWKICHKYNMLESGYESSCGYLEKPSVSPIFVSEKRIKNNFSQMKFYFMLRVLSARVPVPRFIENIILFISIPPIRNKFVRFMTGQTYLKYLIRKIGYFIKNK